MKRGWVPALVMGVAAATGLYGMLAAAERKLPPPEDPWLDGWTRAGLKVESRAVTDDPSRRLLFHDARACFDDAALKTLPLRNYQVQQARAQVLVLPSATLLDKEFPQGRHLNYRLTDKGGKAHACRMGRALLLVSIEGPKIPFFPTMRIPKSTVEAVFDAFEAAVERSLRP